MDRRGRLLEQAQQLHAERNTHQSQLLLLYVEDVLQTGGSLDELEVRLDQEFGTSAGFVPERLSWSRSVGLDGFGIFAEVALESIPFRVRFVPPGSFMMGSPKDEEGRENNEGPQHEVVLSKGFWICEALCTQALWEAVMGANSSGFKSPTRPVENVSFNDCQAFLQKLAGLQGQLPTEAQWEYACRAGTTASTYAGQLKIKGEFHGAVLDEIAWYGGNSGVEFDLEEGFNTSDWPEKQHDHDKAGTRIVGLKNPNGYGLYDTLGNVWEWCQDGLRNYEEGRVVDPVGPQDKDTYRGVRGGGWAYSASVLRAACRSHAPPNDRNNNMGFRFCVMPA